MKKEDFEYCLYMKQKYSNELQGLYDIDTYLKKRIRKLEIQEKFWADKLENK